MDKRKVPSSEGIFSLELQADEILRMDRVIHQVHVSLTSDWHGILLADQLEMRAFREISMEPHLFDAGLTPGLYRRAYNPLMGIRPPSRPHLRNDPSAFDIRIGMASPHTGWAEDLMSFRDSEWPEPKAHHLDRFQRCRIRRALRDVPPGHVRLRSLTRWLQAAKYGVTIRVILELTEL